jgi:RNA polymerase primary sigma factor
LKQSRLHFPKPLPADEQIALCLRAQQGDAHARHLLVRTNVHFLYRFAHSFAHKTPLLELDDLMSVGVIGLLDAIDRFDTTRGERFLTYATYWVTHHMREAVVKTAIRISAPIDILTQVFANRFGYERSDLLERGISGIEADKAVAKAHGMSADRLLSSERLRVAPSSLDQPLLDEDGRGTLMHEIVADRKDSFEQRLSDVQWIARLHVAVALVGAKLPYSRRVIFAERILAGRKLSEVAEMIDMSGERVRQIEIKLLKDLRKALRADFPAELGHKPEPIRKRLRKVS